MMDCRTVSVERPVQSFSPCGRRWRPEGLTDEGLHGRRSHQPFVAARRPRRRDPSSDLAPLGHLLPHGEKGRVLLFAGDWTAFDAVVEGWPGGDGARDGQGLAELSGILSLAGVMVFLRRSVVSPSSRFGSREVFSKLLSNLLNLLAGNPVVPPESVSRSNAGKRQSQEALCLIGKP